MRSTVAPGTFFSAAALTFAATSLESSGRGGRSGRVSWVVVPVVVGVDGDWSAAPASAAPPSAKATSAETPAASLAMVVRI